MLQQWKLRTQSPEVAAARNVSFRFIQVLAENDTLDAFSSPVFTTNLFKLRVEPDITEFVLRTVLRAANFARRFNSIVSGFCLIVKIV
jgi:NADPH-dependent ferric siderophore reductase